MRIIIFFFVSSSFFFHSCNYEKYKNKAISNKGTWWDVYKINGKVFTNPAYSYFCGVNGDCYYYSVKKLTDGSFKRDIDHDNAGLPDTWKMRSDTIQLRGVDYLVHARTNKKLILVQVSKLNDTLELIESAIR